MQVPKSLEEEQFLAKHNAEVALATRELERRKNDTIRIYNPLDHTFSYMQDGYWHTIASKTTDDVPRYLAIHFFKKICDYMIGQQAMLKGKALKELREKQMGQQYLDHYQENVEIWDRMPKQNDPDLIEQIKKVVILGMVREYGMDQLPEQRERVADKPQDFRSIHEQVLDSIDRINIPLSETNAKPVGAEGTAPVTPNADVNPPMDKPIEQILGIPEAPPIQPIEVKMPGAPVVTPMPAAPAPVAEPPLYVSKKDQEAAAGPATAVPASPEEVLTNG